MVCVVIVLRLGFVCFGKGYARCCTKPNITMLKFSTYQAFNTAVYHMASNKGASA